MTCKPSPLAYQFLDSNVQGITSTQHSPQTILLFCTEFPFLDRIFRDGHYAITSLATTSSWPGLIMSLTGIMRTLPSNVVRLTNAPVRASSLVEIISE
ncbi:dnaJ-like protein subfamily B member 4 [Pyrus ussuriensis x Pyrus communis]|uniref:DnaJ-like protein subfamily B member 4 n=1 Tax=Pyrus ussuriensis x Pyrus communis TaxID=2448454 RepID=A0A5N5HDG5_9ROSA|nr:dnaJ-like protein subfamily B member 4 [Pyrus ussuriensis x Pyrus communis]